MLVLSRKVIRHDFISLSRIRNCHLLNAINNILTNQKITLHPEMGGNTNRVLVWFVLLVYLSTETLQQIGLLFFQLVT